MRKVSPEKRSAAIRKHQLLCPHDDDVERPCERRARPPNLHYVRLDYESPTLDERTGKPFRWNNVLSEAHAKASIREFAAKHPEVKVTVSAVREGES